MVSPRRGNSPKGEVFSDQLRGQGIELGLDHSAVEQDRRTLPSRAGVNVHPVMVSPHQGEFRRPTHLGCEVSAVKRPVEEGGVPVPIPVEYEEVDPVIGRESDLFLYARGVGFIEVTAGGDFRLLMSGVSRPCRGEHFPF